MFLKKHWFLLSAFCHQFSFNSLIIKSFTLRFARRKQPKLLKSCLVREVQGKRSRPDPFFADFH